MLVRSGGHHWRPVQTCSFEDFPAPTRSNNVQSAQSGGTHATKMLFCSFINVFTFDCSVASQSGSDIERASNVTSTVESEEGRLPTPQLVTHPAQRHHLDRTTPAVGGAILVAPSSGNTPPKKGGNLYLHYIMVSYTDRLQWEMSLNLFASDVDVGHKSCDETTNVLVRRLSYDVSIS